MFETLPVISLIVIFCVYMQKYFKICLKWGQSSKTTDKGRYANRWLMVKTTFAIFTQLYFSRRKSTNMGLTQTYGPRHWLRRMTAFFRRIWYSWFTPKYFNAAQRWENVRRYADGVFFAERAAENATQKVATSGLNQINLFKLISVIGPP